MRKELLIIAMILGLLLCVSCTDQNATSPSSHDLSGLEGEWAVCVLPPECEAASTVPATFEFFTHQVRDIHGRIVAWSYDGETLTLCGIGYEVILPVSAPCASGTYVGNCDECTVIMAKK